MSKKRQNNAVTTLLTDYPKTPNVMIPSHKGKGMLQQRNILLSKSTGSWKKGKTITYLYKIA